MLSGVGDAAELRKLGILPVANMRGVGKNLHDHILVAGVVFRYKGKAIDRPADSDGVEAEVYLSSGVDDNPIDTALILQQFPVATPDAAARFALEPAKRVIAAPQHAAWVAGQIRLDHPLVV